MNFHGKKNNINIYLDKLYKQLEKDINSCVDQEVAKKFLLNEYKKLISYKDSVMDEIRYEIEDEVADAKGINEVKDIRSKLENVDIQFREIRIKPNLYVEKKITRNVNNENYNNRNRKSSYKSSTIATSTVAGAVIGGAIKRSIAGFIGGGVIGGIISVCGMILLDNDQDTTNARPQTRTIEKVVRELDKDYLFNLIRERKEEIKREFFGYIDNIERICKAA